MRLVPLSNKAIAKELLTFIAICALALTDLFISYVIRRFGLLNAFCPEGGYCVVLTPLYIIPAVVFVIRFVVGYVILTPLLPKFSGRISLIVSLLGVFNALTFTSFAISLVPLQTALSSLYGWTHFIILPLVLFLGVFYMSRYLLIKKSVKTRFSLLVIVFFVVAIWQSTTLAEKAYLEFRYVPEVPTYTLPTTFRLYSTKASIGGHLFSYSELVEPNAKSDTGTEYYHAEYYDKEMGTSLVEVYETAVPNNHQPPSTCVFSIYINQETPCREIGKVKGESVFYFFEEFTSESQYFLKLENTLIIVSISDASEGAGKFSHDNILAFLSSFNRDEIGVSNL